MTIRQRPHPRFEIFRDKAGKWRWRLRDGNNRKVATSGESFAEINHALRAVANMVSAAIVANDYLRERV